MNVFDRYAPCVREYIYGQDWHSLRGVQVAAGEAIFGSEEHVLLSVGENGGGVLSNHHLAAGEPSQLRRLHLHWPVEGTHQ